MAKKKLPGGRGRAPQMPDPPDSDDDDDLEDPPAAVTVSSGDEVEQILETLGAQASAARIIVHRIAANQDPEECIDCPLSTFSKDQLRAQFGAGVYSCEVRHKGTIRRRWQWRFAAPIAPSSATPARSTEADRLQALELELRQAREKADNRQHEMLMALMARPQAESNAPSLGELITTLQGLKDLSGGGGGNTSTVAQIKELLEVSDLLGGGGGGGRTNGMDLAKVALESLGPSLGALLQAGSDKPARAPRQLTGPGAAASPADKMSASSPAGDGDKRAMMLSMLLEHAKQGTDPAAAAQVVYERLCALDESQFEAACEFIDSEGALSLALMFEPRLQPARAWLEQLLEQLRAAILQGDTEAALTSGQAAAQGAGVSS